jgi:drug/metabolite transporter (DMT)-like permease
LLGGASYSLGSLFFFLASKYTGTGVAMVIFFCFPVFVTLFSWVTTSWRMNIHAAMSLIAIIAGLMLLKGHGSHRLSLTGIIFAILAGISYAIYVIYSKNNIKNIDSNLLTFLVCLGNTLIFFVLSCATKSFYIPHTLHAWFYISALGIVATAIPIQLLLDGIKHISPIKASILSVLEPVVTLLVGVTLLNESMSGVQAAGIMIILFGAILIQFERQKV